ncbi:ZmpA/ZmpB/ZmpC family metallo-endopeptidase [Lactobacillus johnsonii]|uniref:ZmpA/ZmpB/ZmpC family metallo-endopeptidase n=1 Tax=Lactobacillus johnsonii TaxID=33959 RepID=UPI00398AB99C
MQKNSQYRYALRKLSVGLTSVAVGLAFMATTTTTVHADSEPQVQKTENQTSDNKNEITVAENTNSNSAKIETVTPQDNTQDDKTSLTNVETKTNSDVDLPDNNNLDLKNDQSTVENQNTILKEDTNNQENNISDDTTSDQQSKQTEEKYDPNLIKSVTDSLKQVKHDAFDGDPKQNLRNWNNIVLSSSSLIDSFYDIYNQLPTLVPQLLEHADNIDTARQRVSSNAGEIMIGMSYLNRWYNVSYGDKTILPAMMFNPKSFGSNLDSIDWLSNIGNLSPNQLNPGNTVTTFNEKLAPMLNTKSDLVTFLGDLRKKWTPELSDEDWFRSNTGVYINEIFSKELPDLNLHIYHRLSTNKSLQEYILPLLNIKSDDMYVVSALGTVIFGSYDPYIDVKYHKDPEVYQEKVQAVHKEITRLSTGWREYFDFWYRIANNKGKTRLANANTLVWDSYDAIDSSKKGGRRWLTKKDTDIPAMAKFFGPLGKTYPPPGITADAGGNEVRYYVAKVISDYGGAAIFSHEMTHIFDNSIYLDGFQHRPGTGVELYAEGLLQSPWNSTPASYGLNTVLTFDAANRTTNKSPQRFQSREDLHEYMHGLFDVTYLLDYAEAQAMVDKSAKEKQLMYSQISYDSAKKSDVITGPISSEVAEKLTSIDDFIDNNIIASRGYKAGTYGNNVYQQISMYAPDYAGVQSATSASGGITFRKTAFELLAAKGWNDGFISYVTNKYAKDAKNDKKSLSDTYALEKIFRGEYNNDYATFKKAMFKERIDKRQDFKPITITLNKKNVQLNNWDDLQNLMQSTVDQELALRSQGKGASLINDLKAAILAAELKQTDDFRSSIFANPEQNKRGDILGDGTNYELPTYDLDSLKKGEAVGDGTKLDLPSYDLNSLKKGEVVGDGTKLDLPSYDLDSLKKGEVVGDGTELDLPSYALDSLKKGEVVGDGTELDLPSYDLASLKKSEVVGDGTKLDLPSCDLDSPKKGEVVGEGTKLDVPSYDLASLKKSEVVGNGTKLDLPSYDLDSLKKGESVSDSTRLDVPSYDLASLKKGEVVGDGTKLGVPSYALDSLKKSEVGEGTKLDLPSYDLDSLKKGEVVGEGTNLDLPSYALDSLKKGEVVGNGTNLGLPTYDLASLKKGESVSDSTRLDVPSYDLDSLKKGEVVGAGTELDLPSYALASLKKGEVVGYGTKLGVPSYDLDSLKKGEVVGEGTNLDLPTYDLDSLKKGESLSDSTRLDVPSYDLDSLKKGESVSDSTKVDLPSYDLDSLKKGEVVGEGTKLDVLSYDLASLKKRESVNEGTKLDLPSYDLDSLKKGEVVGAGTELDLPSYDLASLKKRESVNEGTNLDLPSYDLASLKKGEEVGNGTKLDVPSYDLDSLKKSESITKKLPIEDNKSTTKLDALENKPEINSNNKSTETNSYKKKKFTKLFKFDAKMNKRHVSATSTNNASLPQAGSKNPNFAVVLVGISSLFTALGLNILKKKTK